MIAARLVSRRSHPGRILAAAVLAVVLGLILASCSGGTNAVDSNAGGQYRYVQSTKKGELFPAADR
ncbi:MAG: TlpA family protein disulfide reductase [Frankiales bacterium]|nr:TlpA family protein disulfide reductase [Frankiales bacterium]